MACTLQSNKLHSPSRNFCVNGVTRKRGNNNKASESTDYKCKTNKKWKLSCCNFLVPSSLWTNFECFNTEEDGKKMVFVRIVRGDFKFTPNPADETLVFQSYISGYHNYAFDAESKLWLSIKSDRHDLRGMVTRDFLRHCTGCIQFP